MPAYGQPDYSPGRQELLLAARQIIAEAGVCAFTTLGPEGIPRTRAMDAFAPDEHFVVWLATNPHSRKVAHIRQHPLVNLYWFHKPGGSYVLLAGKAELIDAAAAKKQYWKPEWKAFYPNYPHDYLLIRVTPLWLEVLSESRGLTGDSLTWQPPRVVFDPEN